MARIPTRALAGSALLLTTAAAMAQFNTVRGQSRFAPARAGISIERTGERRNWTFGTTTCRPNELMKLTDAEPGPGDGFGSAASADGDVLVIGAPEDDQAGAFSGSATVFRFDGTAWQHEQKLTASDASEHDWFGIDVSVDGDVIAIGAGEGADNGLVYIFGYDGETWTQQARLSAADAAFFDGFGYALDLDGDTLAIGAPGDDEGRGSAYVFQNDGGGWNQIAKVTSAAGDPEDYLGCPVGLSGDYLIAGAFGDADNGPNAGAAYVFERNRGGPDNWGLRKKLVTSDIEAGDYFGVAIAIDGERALIASRLDNFGAGSAYIFERTQGGPNNWGEVTKLSALDGADGHQFGWSLQVDGDIALVGARFATVEGIVAGAAYVYSYDGEIWTEEAKLTASDVTEGDAFGSAAALTGEWAIVGAALDDDGGNASGSAYVFRGLGDCNNNSTLDICDIDSGTSEDLNKNGIPDECEAMCDPCDMNCDGQIDAFDIEPFLDLLFDPKPMPCDTCTGDVDGNGVIDAFDIEPFLNCLFP